jgi:Holliday junction resolvase RusA-like endonuclease
MVHGMTQILSSDGRIAITFNVDWRPCPWTVYTKRGEQPPGFYKFKAWQEVVKAAAIVAMGGRPALCGPVVLEADFYLPLPALPKYLHLDSAKTADKRDAWLAKHLVMRPDATNLLKAFEDACTGLVWKDDSQVVKTVITKQFGNFGCTIATISASRTDQLVGHTHTAKLSK